MVALETRPWTQSEDRITLDLHLDDRDPSAELEEIRTGLLHQPPEISPRYLYDEHGSHLFEQICTTPEYYQTRTEGRLLSCHASEIMALSGAEELVELGSGAASKTRILLDAMQQAGHLRLYVPFDVNQQIVRRTADELIARYPGLRVHGVVGDFTHHVDRIPAGERRLVIFLGGTIGNFKPDDAVAFMTQVARAMAPGDFLLLGTDLIKPTERLEAAYNDAQGITAEFNRNILRVINRRLEGDFDPDAFTHRAIYNPAAHQIEMYLRSGRDQVVSLPLLGMEIGFPAGRQIRTEISVKYDRSLASRLLTASGFEPRHWFTDPEGLFALSLARRR